MKKLVLVLLCFVMVTSFAFAQGTQEAAAAKPTVVLLNVGMQSPYPPLYSDNLEKHLNDAGIEMFMFDGKFDAQLQSSQMDDAIAMRPNVIILFPVDSAALATSIKKAYDAGIPVVMGNGEPQKASVPYTALYFGPNNYEEGKVAANMANELLGAAGGNVVIVEGATGQDSTVYRTKGFKENINSNIKVLAAQPADWVKDDAVRVMSDFLTSYKGQINLVWSESDDMGAGVGIALEEAGYKPGEILHISLGGSKAGMESIKAGWITHLIMQSPIDETDQLAPFVIKVVEEGWKAGKQWDPYWNYMNTPVVDTTSYEQYLPGF